MAFIFLGCWLALLLMAVLFGCDAAGTRPEPEGPQVTVDTATVHYWGDRGALRLTLRGVPAGARVRVDHPLCRRTVFAGWAAEGSSAVDTTWTAPRCPPPPGGSEAFQAVLWKYGGPVLATGTFIQHERYGTP